MKILIIGGTGIISSAVVDESIERGYEVTMLNRGRNVTFINPKAFLIKCNVYDTQDVKNKLQGLHFDTVVDFLVRTEAEIEYSLSLFGDIADQYVFISSAQIYNTSINGCLNENSEIPQPLWAYSVNKAICERIVENKCKDLGVNYTVIRPGVNYGNTRIPYGMFPFIGSHWTIVSRIIAGKPIITWNNGQNKLNLTRVEDFARGAVGLLGNPKAFNEIVNVVGDFVYSWQEVLDTLGKLIGHDVRTVNIPVEFYAQELDGDSREGLLGGRATDLVCSNLKLKNIVPEYKTKYDLESGLRLTLDFYKSHNYYQGFDYSWDGDCDRIISKYHKHCHAKPDNSLRFVNYENFGDVKQNKSTYNMAFWKDSKLKRKFMGVIQRIGI